MIDVVVVGSGDTALCAAIAARAAGAEVLVVEKADEALGGGNSRYTAGAMRFAYDGAADLAALLDDPHDPRLATTDFGSYTTGQFATDLLGFNDGFELSREQRILVDESLPTMCWLAEQGVRFEPIYDRQSFVKDGRHVFWGGLTLAAAGEGPGLVDRELAVFEDLGGTVRYGAGVTGLIVDGATVTGVVVNESEAIAARSVVLACGGFEADENLRVAHLGDDWRLAKVRGTPHNTGVGLELAFAQGAERYGIYANCHATPMDLHMPDHGNLDLPHLERKNYRKICYFLGIMINARGERFVDEGRDFRNYTYAQFGRAVLEQPGHFAWQLFDAKVFDLLYGEYRFHDAHFVEADDLDELVDQLAGVDRDRAAQTIAAFNHAVDDSVPFDPTVRDGRGAPGLSPPRTNWAQRLDTPPFRAYPVTGGITFTYGGLRVDDEGAVLREDGSAIDGLFACGELVGGVFFGGYPGGSGLTSGAVFGRRAGAPERLAMPGSLLDALYCCPTAVISLKTANLVHMAASETKPTLLAAVEAGGTKFRAAVVDTDLQVVSETRIPTTDPDETIGAVLTFFADQPPVAALGVASFGPLIVDPASTGYGSLAATPKPHWSGAPLLARLAAGLAVPAEIQTDVEAAAVAEFRLGAGRGLQTVAYVTVGTGVGIGIAIDGVPFRGRDHIELGHIPIHRSPEDQFAGTCPFHGDCLEGMACGPAIERRWKEPASGLDDRDEVWALEAEYLAQLCQVLTYAFAPDRILFSGGVGARPDLAPLIADATSRRLAGYSVSHADATDLIATAALGNDAGLMGAALLARTLL